MTTLSYAQSVPLAERQQQCERIAAKYGDGMVPVVLETVGKNAKANFTALPSSATVADLQTVLRALGGASKRTASTLTIANCTPSATATLGDLQAACKNADDGFLYVQYATEKTMGTSFAGPCFAGNTGGGGGVDTNALDNAYGGIKPLA